MLNMILHIILVPLCVANVIVNEDKISKVLWSITGIFWFVLLLNDFFHFLR